MTPDHPPQRDSSQSVAGRLSQKLGKNVDPGISLDGTPQRAKDESGILEQLESQGELGRRYSLQSEVARGGMGAIIKVWDANLRRHLAMKVVLQAGQAKSADEVDPKMLERFLEEAQVTGQLDHPGIVPVHELGLDEGGGVYFTMRLVKGRDLGEVYRLERSGDEEWNQTRVLGVLLRVCEAMAYAHDKGVIHRDLKPANVMVGSFGEVYVMDWGLARVSGRKDIHDARLETGSQQLERVASGDGQASPLRTMDGDVIGTPAYMAPEQAYGRIGELGPRSDIYSVGAMIYALMSGVSPYSDQGEEMNAFKVLMAVREGPPTRLSQLNSDVPVELEAICEKAMAREATDRYATMTDLARDLRAFLEQRVVSAYEAGAVAEIKKWVARNKGFAAVSAAAILLLIAGLATSSTLFVRAERNAELAEERRIEAEDNESLAREEKARADENATEARRNETLALARKAEAEAEREKVLRLSDVKRIENLELEASGLWPAFPERVEDYEAWIASAQELERRLPEHRAALEELRAVALPPLVSDTPAPDGEEASRTWRFSSPEQQWQHDVLAELVANMGAFLDPERGRLADVRRRLDFARVVEERTLTSDAASEAWDDACVSVADEDECPMYGGLEIAPQLGLLPIGRDPDSGLWEFAHVQSGEVPERDADDRLEITEETCVVLVLVPGGTFWMGAQKDDAEAPNYDARARDITVPVHEVTLEPFYVSKFELTQGQWERFDGQNPSNYLPGKKFGDHVHDLRHPVEQVSYSDAMRVLTALDLTLPTEARWEFAARAGTQATWATGGDRESLVGAANLADATASKAGATWPSLREWPEFDDGFVAHAPIGSFRPNGFGLHDVHGNVWEWCLDWYDDYDLPVEPGTGLRQATKQQYRVYRGTGFLHSLSRSGVGFRDANVSTYRASSVGVRPARSITRAE